MQTAANEARQWLDRHTALLEKRPDIENPDCISPAASLASYPHDATTVMRGIRAALPPESLLMYTTSDARDLLHQGGIHPPDFTLVELIRQGSETEQAEECGRLKVHWIYEHLVKNPVAKLVVFDPVPAVANVAPLLHAVRDVLDDHDSTRLTYRLPRLVGIWPGKELGKLDCLVQDSWILAEQMHAEPVSSDGVVMPQD